MTLRELLKATAPCRVPDAFINSIGSEIGVNMDTELATAGVVAEYRSRARLYIYLATVPSVSEGGVSVSFSAQDKKLFLDLARKYANFAGEDGLIPGAAYGYKGENL